MLGETEIFTGFALAERILAGVRAQVARIGRAPVAVTLHDPSDAPAAAYLARQRALAAGVGVDLRPQAWGADPEAQLPALAANPGVDAVVALTPLPEGLSPARAAALIGPAKDAEGLHPLQAGALLLGDPARPPVVAEAARLCATAILGDLTGAEVVIIGASRRIGRPLALLLSTDGATVTLTQATTRDLAAHTRRADLIISAAGVPGLLGRAHVALGGRVLDLAVIPGPEGLRGDADHAALLGHAALLSHVPDGVGPVTTACLLSAIATLADRTLP